MTQNNPRYPKALSLMVQGTASNSGKSLITAALLRILRRRGIKAAPFKAQNMALNSFVTAGGEEIGRAQALQAEAAGVEPTADMNPILLKPTGERTSQVVIHGKVHGNMSATEYHAFKREAKRYVAESWQRLSSAYEAVVIEGAGSPAEVNLRENDLANMGIAEMTGSPVILVGDIDRGGVFASLYGTLALLEPCERERIKGLVINKFRGEVSLLKGGLDFIEEKTERPVLGVVPYLDGLMLPQEDGVGLEGMVSRLQGGVRITVVRLPRISNFTDFDPLSASPEVKLDYIETPEGIEGADAVVLPGTKNTIEDLRWLKERGFLPALQRFKASGGLIIGICGGFQMLGRVVRDPHGMESEGGSVEAGLSFLDAETVLLPIKKTFQVSGEAAGCPVTGYEIHMGETASMERPFSVIRRRGEAAEIQDGAIKENVIGTYVHGIFDNDGLRVSVIEGLKRRKGLSGRGTGGSYRDLKEASLDRLADCVEGSLDMAAVLRIMGLA